MFLLSISTLTSYSVFLCWHIVTVCFAVCVGKGKSNSLRSKIYTIVNRTVILHGIGRSLLEQSHLPSENREHTVIQVYTHDHQ